MPAKAGKGPSKQKGQEEQREATLQAVVLTDSYDRGFSPFAQEKPRCLLPVANVVLIEYTLEFLANAGIRDIYLYVGAHEEQVEDYIKNSTWMSSTSPFAGLTILRCPATSVGDAMRDLDKRDVITGDFVLVIGDLISNINLDSALAQHRARRGKDPNAIMTMVLRESGRDHRSKPRGRKPFFFIDPQHDRCLHYEEISKNDRRDRRFHLDSDLLAKPEIDVRGDLVDCSIDICTIDVLGLWTDNFDYKSIRSSFLRGVLQDYELNGKTIHTHIVDEGYAARVSSLRAYDAVTKDIISRWTYPFTPDCNLMRGHKYRLLKNKIYLEAGVVLARGSTVKARSILGKDTSLGDGSTITNSVIGRRCQIGKNVNIRDSYIWDDVVIGDNCNINSAIIADEAVLGRDCSLQPGTLLSYRVRLSNKTTLQPKTRLTHARRPFRPGVSPPSDSSLVGPQGAGAAFTPSSDSESSSPFSSPLLPPSHHRRSSTTSTTSSHPSISTLHSGPSSPTFFPERRDSAASFPSSTADDFLIPGSTAQRPSAATATFLAEATASIQDGILKNDDPDTVKLELLSQRLTYDASDASMRDAIARALIRSIFVLISPSNPSNPSASPATARGPPGASAENGSFLSSSPGAGASLSSGLGGSEAARQPMPAKEATTHVMKAYSALLVQLGLFDAEDEEKRDQVAALREMEGECEAQLGGGGGPGDKVLLFAVDALHRELEVLEDEAVLQWWDGVGDVERGDGEVEGEGNGKGVRRLVKTYVQWVREAESESSGESDEDEDEEEDEDADDE